MTTFFSWSDFDKGVEYIANKCKFLKISGIYGIPRGGLCLAVALSHKLNIKLISKPIPNALIVDDVYETGETLNDLRNINGANFFVLISKKEPTWWHTFNLTNKNEWIVFPWENQKNYLLDQKKYKERGHKP